MTRRALLAGLGASMLVASGCAYVDRGKRAWALLAGGRAPPITRGTVSRIEAASLSVKFGRRRPEGLIVLSRIEGRNLIWQSPDRVLLVTRGGRLMQTAGLTYNMTGTVLTTPDPVDGELLNSDGVESNRLLDYADDYGRGLDAYSRFRVVRREPITILDVDMPTWLVYERVRVPALKWRFRNKYWVHEETGAVWRSRQAMHLELPPVTLTTLRPARMAP